MIGTAFAQASGAAQGSGTDTLMSMLPILVMFGVLYFLMIRPQMKKAKEHKTMVEALQKGDEVVAAGLLGKVTRVTDAYLALEVAPNVTIQVQRQAVTQLLPKGTMKDAQ
jgi:preprotein translocase subunit YajC